MRLHGLRLLPEETAWLRRAEELAQRADARGYPVLTDFLTPRERMIAEAVAADVGVFTAAWGGHEEAERQRLILQSWEGEPDAEAFEIDVLGVTVSDGAPLSHGAVLGSVLGLGVERRRVGDIAVLGPRAWMAVCRGTSDFVLGSLRRVGRREVALERLAPAKVGGVDGETWTWPKPRWEPSEVTVPSLRLDAVVAHACHWPRADAQRAVANGSVSVNHVPITAPDHEVQEGDLLSVRGFGRVRVEEVQGATRKARLRLRLGIIRSRG
ncbi:MAG: hypothetical protein IRZ10_02600 [Thermoflavifilum sp.]|nr:hypothetical protein [Thermoflavifilum sp.]MCL6513284.1 hypothetical protein [Alicyclobacillus sp.]